MAKFESIAKCGARVLKYIKEHPEEIRLGIDKQFLELKEDFKNRFDALPPDKQIKLMRKLNELENEDSGE